MYASMSALYFLLINDTTPFQFIHYGVFVSGVPNQQTFVLKCMSTIEMENASAHCIVYAAGTHSSMSVFIIFGGKMQALNAV